MVLLESKNIKKGTSMPSFNLYDTNGILKSLSQLKGLKGTVIIFTCNHCPYAKAIWGRLIKLHHKFQDHGIEFVAINPNINPDYPEDNPEKMKQLHDSFNLPFSYLIDTDQSVAKQYQAVCTPDIYLLNHDNSLIYHGALDNNWQNENLVTTQYLCDAITSLINKKTIEFLYPTSMGCSIKWV